MKVLHVYRTYFPDTQGGVEEVIRQICLNSRAFGIESRIFTVSADPQPKVVSSIEGDIVRAKRNFEIASTGFSLQAFAEFKRQAQWADIVHYHFPWPFADLLHSTLPKGKKSVVTYHSDIVRQKVLSWLYRPLMKRFLSSVDRIVATSPNYLASSEVLHRYQQKLSVIPIGLSESSYANLEADSACLQQVENQYGTGYFFFVGILRYYKGLHLLLEAMHGMPFKLIVAGTGPAELELKQQAQQLGLDNVEFTGFVSDEEKAVLMVHAKAVILPSHLRSEAFGVTLVEAAMFGKAMISTEVGTGTSYINLHGQTGLVVEAGSVQSLQAAMQRLNSDHALCTKFAEQARQRYESLFNGEKMGEAYSHLYAQLCQINLDQLEPLATEGVAVAAEAGSVRRHYLP